MESSATSSGNFVSDTLRCGSAEARFIPSHGLPYQLARNTPDSQAVFIGGGLDNVVENNIFVDCDPAVHVDGRCVVWARIGDYRLEILRERLATIDYRSTAWREGYPEFIIRVETDLLSSGSLIIMRNVMLGGRWLNLQRHVPYISPDDTLAYLEDNILT